jgi:hypothetical protein
MRIFNQCVFDSYVGGSYPTYTDPQYDKLLGSAEKLALQAIADQVTGTTPSLTVRLEHSADQRNWMTKNATAELSSGTLTTPGTVSQFAIGADAGSVPGLGFVRLNILMAGTSPAARLRIFATGHAENQGG